MLKQEKNAKGVNTQLLSCVRIESNLARVDAQGLGYKDLNSLLRLIVCDDNIKRIEISNVCGQRYIGTDLKTDSRIDIYGTPGNDLGAFMNGPRIVVHGNAQEGCGNTMNDGQIVIHGSAGDIIGHSLRGGSIFIRDNVGYRVGIHMKEYQRKIPKIVIGGVAQDFLAEYMAGGIVLVLGLTLAQGERCRARFVGTGMHGGVIYERGDIIEVSEGTKLMKIGKRDAHLIDDLVKEYCSHFGIDPAEVLNSEFYKIMPLSKRPYENLYSH